VTLLGERHWVHKRFHRSITAADHEAGFTYMKELQLSPRELP
jgi:hypothetical protein